MSSGSSSRDISLRSRSPRAGTSANTVEVSTVDSSGKRMNVSIECLDPSHRTNENKDHGRTRRRRYCDSERTAAEATLSPDSRPLALIRKSGKHIEKSDSATGNRTVPCAKIHSPRSAKHSRLQHKLRNYVLDSDPDQMRQQLREAQDKNLELEQKLQLKSAELTGLKRRENELRDRERELFGQLRDANDQIKDVEEDRDAIRLRYRTAKRELRNTKLNVEEKESQMKLLEARLNESTELLGSNLKSIKNRSLNTLSSPIDIAQPSTSSGISNITSVPKNDGNIFEDMMNNFNEMLENQLQCSICNEVSTTLTKKVAVTNLTQYSCCFL